MKIKLTKYDTLIGSKYLMRYQKMIAEGKYSLRMENFCRYIYTFYDYLYKTTSYDRMRLFILYAIYKSDPVCVRYPFNLIAKKSLYLYMQNQKIPTDFFVKYGSHRFVLTYNFYDISVVQKQLSHKEFLFKYLKPILMLCVSETESEKIIDDICYQNFASLEKLNSHKYYKLVTSYISEMLSLKK